MSNYGKYSDQQLATLLQSGDRAAFAEIYERYKGPLYIHAFHRLRNREETKDLIQQLFATLWANRESLSLKSHLSGYLYTSVRNRVFKFIAHQQVESSYISSIESVIESGDYITDHLVREREMLAIIEKEIAALPAKMREVFELSRKQHLSHQEIAERLQVTEKTVRNQIYNATQILRVKLGIFGYLLFLLHK